MKHNLGRKLLALFLTAAMLVGMVPAMAVTSAAEDAILTLGEPVNVYGDTEFMFTPEESGTYRFYSVDNEGDPYANLYDAEGSRIAGDDDGNENMNFTFLCDLTAGETYWFSVNFYGDGGGSCTVCLEEYEILTITPGEAVTITENTTFFFTPAETGGYRLRATDVSGNIEPTLRLSSSADMYPVYRSGFSFISYMEAGVTYTVDVGFYLLHEDEESGDPYAEKKYTLQFDAVTTAELTVGASVEVTGDTLLTIDPSKDGIYRIYTTDETGKPHLDLYFAEMYQLGYDGEGEDSASIRNLLNQSSKYCVVASIYDQNGGSYRVNMEEIETVTLTPDKTVAITEPTIFRYRPGERGFYRFYSTDASETVCFDLFDNNYYWQDYYAGSPDFSAVFGLYDRNNYYLDTYFADGNSGSCSVGVEKIIPTSIEVGASVQVTGEKIFSFTPAESGFYRFYSTDGTGAPAAYLYDDDLWEYESSNAYEEKSDFFLSCELTVGNNYYFRVSSGAGESCIAHLTKYEPIPLELGKSAAVSGETVLCFVPEVTGIYRFRSSALANQMLYANLLNYELISFASSSECDEYGNFVIEHRLGAGKPYYLQVNFYGDSEEGIGSCTVEAELLESLETGWLLENGVLTIYPDCSMDGFFYPDILPPWYEWRYEINEVVLADGVTEIGNSAFVNCVNLQSVTIPGSVTRIGNLAFQNCSSLQSVTVPAGVTFIGGAAFYGCISLLWVTLPETLETIGSDAFDQCSSLTDISIPGSVTSIKSDPFTGCSSLHSIFVAGDNTVYCSVEGILCSKDQTVLIAFPGGRYGNAVIPDGIQVIGSKAFYGCSNILGIEFPDSIKTIEHWAFGGCGSLTELMLPESVTSIGMCAFYECYALQSVMIPAGVESIGVNAFFVCERLTDIYCEATEQPAGWDEGWLDCCDATVHWGFNGEMSGVCGDDLTWTLSEDGTLTVSGNGAMYDFFPGGEGGTGGGVPSSDTSPWYSMRKKINKVVIEPGVTSIGWCAFCRCEALTSVTIPESVTEIHGGAFAYCRTLGEITLPSGIKRIGTGAFGGSGLRHIEIPEGVEVIEAWGFDGCSRLEAVSIPGSVTDIGYEAFLDCSSLVEFSVDPENTAYQSVDGILYNAAMTELICCPGGKPGSVTVPEGVVVIGESGFSQCDRITEIKLPDSMKTICDYAFFSCESLLSITISKGVTEIGYNAFGWCSSLSEIIVSEENTAYCSIDGLLYSADGSSLILCPRAKEGELKLPVGVKKIESWAIEQCGYITSLILPAGLRKISTSAIGNCDALESVSIPASVVTIDYMAFFWCQNLTDVYCEVKSCPAGWAEFWLDCCDNATIHWGDAEPEAPMLTPDTPIQVNEETELEFTVEEDGLYRFSASRGMGYPAFELFDAAHNRLSNSDYAEITYEMKTGETYYLLVRFLDNPPPPRTGSAMPAGIGAIEATGSCTVRMERVPMEPIQPGDIIGIDGSVEFKFVPTESGLYKLFVTEYDNETILEIYNFHHCYIAGTIEYDFIKRELTAGETYYFRVYFYGRTGLGNGILHLEKAEPLKWTLEDGVLTVYADVEMDDYDSYDYVAPWDSRRDEITSVVFENGVTKIGAYAFYDCTSLTSMTIPNSVTEIGWSVFRDCDSLTDIYCEAAEQPAGWNFYWLDDCSATVHWGWKGEETIPGDINGDKLLSIMDVTALLQALAKHTGSTFNPLYDLNTDNTFSIMDVTKLLQMLAKAA